MSHSRVPLEGRSYALLADSESPLTAVVFVHGFDGDSGTTWQHFQTLVDGDTGRMYPWWGDCDLYFYSYPSVSAQIAPNADDLLEFLKRSFPEPRWSEEIRVFPKRRYERLLLVGHSEGAVVTRATILTRAKEAENLASDLILAANLRLFAPVLFGKLVSSWKGVLASYPVFKDQIEPLLNASPAYQQLQREDPVLQEIRDETVWYATQYPDIRAFRAHTLFAKGDQFIDMWVLRTDPRARYENGRDHRNICKPDRDYLTPLSWVKHEEYRVPRVPAA
jgi:pimeloyl-ACP methyl ester carboxylesterase